MIKHSGFVGGGLVKEELKEPALQIAMGTTLPRYIDSVPFCIPASNQGNKPSCAGQATAGYIEVHNYRKTHHQKQVDGLAIYREAKRIDGDGGDGTTLTAAIQAAKNLDLIEFTNLRTISRRSQLQYAMLTHDVVIAGFMITDNWNHVNTSDGWIEQNGATDLGGHAVLINWYSEDGVGWQNSWGLDWGCQGNGKMGWKQFDQQFMYAVVIEK